VKTDRIEVNMPADQSADQLSRRKALRIIVGSAGAAVSLPALGKPVSASIAACQVMPAAVADSTTGKHVAKFFNSEQMEEIAALCETIIPTDDHSPGARAAAVHEYVDDVVAVADQKTKDVWSAGLAGVDSMAQQSCGRRFAECDAGQQTELLEKLATHEDHPQTSEERFFVTLKRATVEGYYTSAIGIHQDLQYKGNEALPDFPGCTHPEHKG
jgi:hypothetical protein